MPKPVKAWKDQYNTFTHVQRAWYILLDNGLWSVIDGHLRVDQWHPAKQSYHAHDASVWCWNVTQKIQEVQKRPPDWVAESIISNIEIEFGKVTVEDIPECTCGGTKLNLPHSDWCDIK